MLRGCGATEKSCCESSRGDGDGWIAWTNLAMKVTGVVASSVHCRRVKLLPYSPMQCELLLWHCRYSSIPLIRCTQIRWNIGAVYSLRSTTMPLSSALFTLVG